jgi:hypothetical protein
MPLVYRYKLGITTGFRLAMSSIAGGLRAGSAPSGKREGQNHLAGLLAACRNKGARGKARSQAVGSTRATLAHRLRTPQVYATLETTQRAPSALMFKLMQPVHFAVPDCQQYSINASGLAPGLF